MEQLPENNPEVSAAIEAVLDNLEKRGIDTLESDVERLKNLAVDASQQFSDPARVINVTVVRKSETEFEIVE